MEYQALYRRYRPATFAQVRGQEHVVKALQNAVREGRVGHAYLLSGPRGTGKTTLARLLAKVLNCPNAADGEPCDNCESCASIDAGTSFDLHELDAASNNKVEDIRDLISKVNLGTPGRQKVYLLDEVHMLTSGAENALLKTLEEPPGHVVFVMATTEPHKVVPTIRSRTQHLELTLLPAATIAEHVRWVAADAGLELTDDMLEYVVERGGGSARDTLSALDQVISAGGITDRDTSTTELLEALARSDAGQALAGIAGATERGIDPRTVGESLIAALRDVFLLSMGSSLGYASASQKERAAAFVERLSPPQITRALDIVGTALVDMRRAPDPRIDLEVALVKITRVEADTSVDALAQRIAALERTIAAGGPVPASAPAASAAQSPPASSPAPVSEAAAALAAPPRSEGRSPADQARAELRNKRDGSSGPAPPPVPKAAPAAPPPPAPDSPDAESQASEMPAPEPTASEPVVSEAEAPEVAAPEPATPEPATPDPVAPEPAAVPPSGAVDAAMLQAGWDTIKVSLSNKARARFASGSFTAISGTEVTYSLPNEHHRKKCEELRSEFEQAVSAYTTTPMTVLLVTG
ncbi:MAG: DNA polymerase III subunit gamma/tau, partial [Acidimicrobiales bacterium]|nr:DNA polymerase III subunit gamma/tau [Acidimicrobiales bacterium]